MGFEELLFASLGEEKSNRSLFGPGKRNTRALKWDSETFLGQSRWISTTLDYAESPTGISTSSSFTAFLTLGRVHQLSGDNYGNYSQARMLVEIRHQVGSQSNSPPEPGSPDLQLLRI